VLVLWRYTYKSHIPISISIPYYIILYASIIFERNLIIEHFRIYWFTEPRSITTITKKIRAINRTAIAYCLNQLTGFELTFGKFGGWFMVVFKLSYYILYAWMIYSCRYHTEIWKKTYAFMVFLNYCGSDIIINVLDFLEIVL